MSFLNIFARHKKAEGYIGCYNLSEWWFTVLTKEERILIEDTYKPLGFPQSRLTKGDIHTPGQSATMFLLNLSGWFRAKKHRIVQKKILDRAQTEVREANKTIELHCLYDCLIDFHYKERENQESLDQAISACKSQIALSPEMTNQHKSNHKDFALGTHRGFEQLAIILEKQNNYAEAINLCKQAMDQGWAGDWDKRIARCELKITKEKIVNRKKGLNKTEGKRQ